MDLNVISRAVANGDVPPESTASAADPPAAVRTEAVLKAQDPPYQGADCFRTIASLASVTSDRSHAPPARGPPGNPPDVHDPLRSDLAYLGDRRAAHRSRPQPGCRPPLGLRFASSNPSRAVPSARRPSFLRDPETSLRVSWRRASISQARSGPDGWRRPPPPPDRTRRAWTGYCPHGRRPSSD